MKKIISILILLSLFTLNSCLFLDNDKDSTVRIGYLAGPTGMGMAKMIIDNNGLDGGNDKYTFTKYADTTTAMQDLKVGNKSMTNAKTNLFIVFIGPPPSRDLYIKHFI